MDKLPSELVYDIFSQLSLEQQLICLHVCRRWQRMLGNCGLFYSINIEMVRFERIMNVFKKSPGAADLVEELDIDIPPYARFDKRTLFTLFPNARVMRVDPEDRSVYSAVSHFKDNIDLGHLDAKVEYIADAQLCELVWQLLFSNLGGRLETLELNLRNTSGMSLIVTQLKQLPVLKKLVLKEPKLKIVYLERLHKNIPSIEDFSLKDVTVEAGGMPSNIKPSAVTKLKFIGGYFRNQGTHIQFHRYMIKKYANTTESECEYNPHIGYDRNDMTPIYVNGLLDFFKFIGSRQSQLLLCGLPSDINPFVALDSVESRIKTLYLNTCGDGILFQFLAQSDHSKRVEKLAVIATDITLLHLIKYMPNLSELSVTFISHRPLFECLDACPLSLKHLIIKSSYFIPEPPKQQLYFIETLYMDACPLNSVLGDILTSCFPNLVKLTLGGHLEESLNITLANPSFQSATFFPRNNWRNDHAGIGFSFESPNHTETKYQFYGAANRTHVDYEDIKDLPVLSVVSLTEKRLCFSHDLYEIKVLPC